MTTKTIKLEGILIKKTSKHKFTIKHIVTKYYVVTLNYRLYNMDNWVA